MPVVPSRRHAVWLLAGYVVAVAVVVLEPFAGAANDSIALTYRAVRAVGLGGLVGPNGVQMGLNVLLLMPLASLAAFVWRRPPWPVWVLVGALGSSCIELTQLLFLSGRQASVSTWPPTPWVRWSVPRSRAG